MSGSGSARVALVTGAGSGIGRASATLLARAGYQVWALGRREEALKETLSLCERAPRGAPHRALSLDLRARAEVSMGLREVERVDALVLNAGICRRTPLRLMGAGATDDDLDAANDDDFDDVLQTNVQGVWNPLRALAPRLAPGGSVVVVSSGLGKLGRAGYGAYAASKHAVLGLMRCAALELAPQVRVNAVCPGWVDTAMSRADIERDAQAADVPTRAIHAKACAGIPAGRFVAPEEVAQLIVFLLSDASAPVTGQSYNISGGEFGV